MGFKDKLKDVLIGILTEEELSVLPRGFQTVGDVVITKLNPLLLEKKNLIAEKYLDLLPGIKSIYLNSGRVKGQFRTPEKIEFLVGVDNSIVKHKEHEVIYKFDITKIMFSMGNLNERKFLATLVKEGEMIVDMFAGIGYFSLPIAKHSKPKKIYSIELNPESFKYLIENVKLNHFEDIITPINGDSKIEVIKLSNSGLKADRVIMGVFPAPKDFIKEALTLAKVEGTIYHYEGIAEKEKYLDLFNEFKEIVELNDFKCNLQAKRFVKSYGPGLYHVVLDILVYKN
ncbi:MAG: class I SAM-dependent methyltransferase family protein [Candidatus Lokiarchaeota archaeon]|nr:class I SAM-dependent methyltransferase family protein [Candidatus Lokiarchaeota archaeon]